MGAMEDTARSEGPSLTELYERVRVEDARLEVDTLGALEFVRVQEILRRHLPPPPTVIRDVGGGTGIHARWLASDGYSVELLDPVPLHIERASSDARRGVSFGVQLGDARNLPWADGSSDVVLLFGPLYHLPESADRAQALSEARRVLRSDGILAAQCINISAGLLDFAKRAILAETGPPPGTEQTLRTGVSAWRDFRPAYFHRPAELVDEVTEAGFASIEHVGVEGPGCMVPSLDADWLDENRREHLLDAARVAEVNPELCLLSHHTIVIARRS